MSDGIVRAWKKPEPRVKKPKRMKRQNKKRTAARYEENFGPKADWVRSLVCVVSGSLGSAWDPIVAAHVRG